MNILSFQPPFEKQIKIYKKRTLRQYKDNPGIYIIKENNVVVYIGMSGSCVVESLYRHFYRWRDCYRGMGCEYRTSYYDLLEVNKYEVAILLIEEKQVNEVERALIWSLKPRDNRYTYDNYFEEKVIPIQVVEDKIELIDDDLPF